MVFKLKTSEETASIFSEIGSSTHLQPFALSKIAIALSVRDSNDLSDSDFATNTDGLELNRQTITGEFDELFKALIVQKEQKSLTDDEYFPKYLKAYIDKGAKLLYAEFKYAGSSFYQHLSHLDKGI